MSKQKTPTVLRVAWQMLGRRPSHWKYYWREIRSRIHWRWVRQFGKRGTCSGCEHAMMPAVLPAGYEYWLCMLHLRDREDIRPALTFPWTECKGDGDTNYLQMVRDYKENPPPKAKTKKRRKAR